MNKWNFWPTHSVRGTKPWDEHILCQDVPHLLKDPYVCNCIACEEWYKVRVIPGALVVGRKLKRDQGAAGGSAWTWQCGESSKWGSPLQKPSLVLGSAPKTSSREDLQCVVVLTPDMGLRVTAAEWLVVLAGGRTAKTKKIK